MKPLTRGQLAHEAGIHAETLRYYERRGLIPEPMRNDSGYRIFNEDIIQRIQFIKHAQRLGFSLSLLALRIDKKMTCRNVKRVAESKINEIDEKIRRLREMRRTLQALAERCSGDDAPTSRCPILDPQQARKSR